MIRVIGLSEEAFNNIIANYYDLVIWHDVNMNAIEFDRSCEICMNQSQVRIYCGDEEIVFLSCDYWRIELV